MNIAQIMSPNPAWVSPRTTVFDAALTMKLLDASMLPVCDHDHLVGTVTDRDIAIRAVATGWDARHTLIADIMTAEPVCCFDDQEAEEAVQIMRHHQFQRLPVLNRENHLVGIISLEELTAFREDEAAPGSVKENISAGGTPLFQAA
jgi:CBS domain-containing protein